MAYYNVNPFGEIREDLRAAKICQTIVAAAGKSTKLASHMLPFPRTYKRRKSPSELREIMLMFAAQHNAGLQK